jgi:hypothetical protein
MQDLSAEFADTTLLLPSFPYLYTTTELLGSSLEDYEKRMAGSAIVTFGKDETPWIVKSGEVKVCAKGASDCEGRLTVWKELGDRFEDGRRGACEWDWEFKGWDGNLSGGRVMEGGYEISCGIP